VQSKHILLHVRSPRSKKKFPRKVWPVKRREKPLELRGMKDGIWAALKEMLLWLIRSIEPGRSLEKPKKNSSKRLGLKN